MREQMESMGLAIDWSREMTACKPEYYKWNQWMFLKMLEKGIIYKKTGTVNWDPIDQTVLANEQVVDGRGWRSGALIEKREIPMYYARITDYADELLDYVDNKLPGWPERVRVMQANWIGKSVGVRFAFPHTIKDAAGELIGDGKMYVFTTRADTIMGVTFCAVAPEHALAAHAAQTNPELAAFIAECKLGSVIEADMATMEKKGMPTGLFVTHPLTGDKVEVWVGNYVLITYGDGAVMGVPAHDERDFAFATKYQLPITQVVTVEGKEFSLAGWQEWYGDKEHGVLVNSGKYDGLDYTSAVNAIAGDLAEHGLGEKKVTFRLRDWGISRQRYWGTPIPMIHCADCGTVPVPEKDLPVVLPEHLVPDGSGNPLNKDEAFLKCDCPQCGKPARRETDTMDTFVDSSWYYMRYTSPGSSEAMVDARNDYWMPMDQYIGGIEHAVMHLLYARFWTKIMRDIGLVKFDEPFVNLLTQGMVLNETYYREDDAGKKSWFNPADIDLSLDDKGRPQGALLKADGQPVEYRRHREDVEVEEQRHRPAGADRASTAPTPRACSPCSPRRRSRRSSGPTAASKAPAASCAACGRSPTRSRRASPSELANPSKDGLDEAQKTLRRELHKILQQADYDLKRIQYNTVVSACMKMLNTMESAKLEDGAASDAVIAEGLSIFLRVLNPVAPHITHVLWEELGYAAVHGDILNAPWPQVDPQALEQAEIEMMIQVNGKLRGSIMVAKGADKASIEAQALACEAVQKYIETPPKKVIVVPGKLISIVV